MVGGAPTVVAEHATTVKDQLRRRRHASAAARRSRAPVFAEAGVLAEAARHSAVENAGRSSETLSREECGPKQPGTSTKSPCSSQDQIKISHLELRLVLWLCFKICYKRWFLKTCS